MLCVKDVLTHVAVVKWPLSLAASNARVKAAKTTLSRVKVEPWWVEWRHAAATSSLSHKRHHDVCARVANQTRSMWMGDLYKSATDRRSSVTRSNDSSRRSLLTILTKQLTMRRPWLHCDVLTSQCVNILRLTAFVFVWRWKDEVCCGYTFLVQSVDEKERRSDSLKLTRVLARDLNSTDFDIF